MDRLIRKQRDQKQWFFYPEKHKFGAYLCNFNQFWAKNRNFDTFSRHNWNISTWKPQKNGNFALKKKRKFWS